MTWPTSNGARLGRFWLTNRAVVSREYLRSLTRGEVRCTVTGQDTYGRTLARCVSDGADLNKAMVWSGMTKQYK